MRKALVLYIPVLHAGYLDLFKRHRDDVDTLYILGPEFIKKLMPLHEEIRALSPNEIKKFVETLGMFESVKVLDKVTLPELAERAIVTADEEISRNFIDRYLPKGTRVKTESVFLRWDEKKVRMAPPAAPNGATVTDFDREIIRHAESIAASGSDWWRRVGATATKGAAILFQARNRHIPSDHVPYIDGDPRDFIKAGVSPELSTALHAEQSLIAEAARTGTGLEGASIYVSAFPCPVCAKLIAYSGIKKCFFARGSATLDGERVLRANGVEIIRVK